MSAVSGCIRMRNVQRCILRKERFLPARVMGRKTLGRDPMPAKCALRRCALAELTAKSVQVKCWCKMPYSISRSVGAPRSASSNPSSPSPQGRRASKLARFLLCLKKLTPEGRIEIVGATDRTFGEWRVFPTTGRPDGFATTIAATRFVSS